MRSLTWSMLPKKILKLGKVKYIMNVYIEANIPYLKYVFFNSTVDSKDILSKGTPRMDNSIVLRTDDRAGELPARIKISKNKNASAPMNIDAAVDFVNILNSLTSRGDKRVYLFYSLSDVSSSSGGGGGVYIFVESS